MKSYHSIEELFYMASQEHCSPGIIVCREQAAEEEISYDRVWDRMKGMISVFSDSIHAGIEDPAKSASGMVGGDSARLYHGTPLFVDGICRKACIYALSAAEANAKMCRIVACPTAGSCGIVPGVLAAVGESAGAGPNEYTRALFTAGGVGEIIAEKAMIAGALGGCQAECGTAVAMAAASAVDLIGGTPEQMGNAMALGLKNVLGLVCDPVGGLVEVPCVKRNGFHAVHALVAAEMAMAGIRSVIPPDEVIAALNQVGHMIPKPLRETSQAGLAATGTGRRIAEELGQESKNRSMHV